MIKARSTALILGIFLLVGSGAMAQGWQFGDGAETDHLARIVIPTVVAIEITDDGSNSNVVFDLSDTTTYIGAQGTTITKTGGGFTGLRAFTNSANDATVTVGVAGANGTTDMTPADNLDVVGLINTTSQGLDGATFAVARGGMRDLLDGDAFQFYVDPALDPGTYEYTVTYTINVNP